MLLEWLRSLFGIAVILAFVYLVRFGLPAPIGRCLLKITDWFVEPFVLMAKGMWKLLVVKPFRALTSERFRRTVLGIALIVIVIRTIGMVPEWVYGVVAIWWLWTSLRKKEAPAPRRPEPPPVHISHEVKH